MPIAWPEVATEQVFSRSIEVVTALAITFAEPYDIASGSLSLD